MEERDMHVVPCLLSPLTGFYLVVRQLFLHPKACPQFSSNQEKREWVGVSAEVTQQGGQKNIFLGGPGEIISSSTSL